MKKLNIWASIPFLLGLITFAVLRLFWTETCTLTSCNSYDMSAYLHPLREGGLVLAVISLPFIFLPYHYFKSWILYLFPLMFLVTLTTLSDIDPNSGNMFNATRGEAMEDFLGQWVIATLVFVFYCWKKVRGGEKVSPGKYLLAALGAILIAFAYELVRVLIGMQFGIWLY